jgi:hypothetical protein
MNILNVLRTANTIYIIYIINKYIFKYIIILNQNKQLFKILVFPLLLTLRYLIR